MWGASTAIDCALIITLNMNAVNTLFETLCGMGWISPAYRPLPVIYIYFFTKQNHQSSKFSHRSIKLKIPRCCLHWCLRKEY
jgi:hypothetical protein